MRPPVKVRTCSSQVLAFLHGQVNTSPPPRHRSGVLHNWPSKRLPLAVACMHCGFASLTCCQ